MELRTVHGPHGFVTALGLLDSQPQDAYLSEAEAQRRLLEALPRARSDRRVTGLLTVTLDIRSAASWWRQAAAYFPEIEWIRARSSDDATRTLLPADFEEPVPQKVLAELRRLALAREREQLEALLPQSFLRRGYVTTSFSVLRRLYEERRHYHYGHWHLFCRALAELPAHQLIVEEEHA